jgi:WD40 repeat protein
MSGVEMSGLKSHQSNLDVYSSHDPEDFVQALEEFNKYCERQLPKKYFLPFTPTCFALAKDEDSVVLGGSIGNVANFSLQKGQVLRDEEISHSHSIVALEVVLNDKQVVALTSNSELFFMEYPSFEVLYRAPLKIPPVSLKSNSKLNLLYLVDNTSELTCISLSDEDDFYTKKFRRRQASLPSNGRAISIAQDGSMFAVSHDSGIISLFHSTQEKYLKSTESHSSSSSLIVFSENNSHLAASFEDYSIKLWLLDNSLTLLRVLSRHSDQISGLAFVRDNKYLVSSSFDSFINVWDLKVDSMPYAMSLNDLKITGLRVFDDHKSVIYTQESENLFVWCVPQLPRNARYSNDTLKITKVIFIPESFSLLTLSEDGKLTVWDYRQDKIVECLVLEGALTNGIIVGENAYVQSSRPCIYVVNTSNFHYDILELQSSIVNFDVSSDESKIATSYSQNSVKIHELQMSRSSLRQPSKYQLSEMYMNNQIRGHTSPVSQCRFIQGNRSLITASFDSTLSKWNSIDGRKECEFIGHNSGVLTFIISPDGFLISGSEDGFVIVWSLNGISLYTMKPPEDSPTLDLYLSSDHSYLVTLQVGRVTYWQMMNLSILFQTDTTFPATSLAFSSDEKFIAVGEEMTTCIEENVLASNNLRIIGRNIGSPHRFMKFVIDCQMEQSKVAYDQSHNHWMVSPYLIGPAHILSYTNRFDDLSRALFGAENKCGFFSTVNGENPLSICIDKEYKNCIDVCLRYMKSQMQGSETRPENLRAYYPLENCLTQLNRIEYPYIVKLYDSLFVESNASYLPRFCLHETELPILYFSEHLTLIPTEIVPEDKYSSTGRPIVFRYSTFPLDLDIGTDNSIDFMKSLLECSHQEIFRSALVIEYLQYKWERVKKVIYVQGFTYVFYLILLGFHIVLFLEDKNFLTILFSVHAALWLFEVWQISTDFSEYWNSIWNVLDQLRGLSFNYYALIAMKGTYNYDILLAVLIFSWARGIACFRMFEPSRSMVRLVIQVILDIRTFFLILFYSTLAFAFVFYMRDPEAQPFAMYLTRAYRLDLGDFETDLTEYFDWGIFFVSTMINPLIMLNLLIAIMSDTAAAGAEVDDICGRRELTEMILDVEKIMFWKKGICHKHYLQKCDFVNVEDEEVDKTMEKIKFIKKQVVGMKGLVKGIQRNAEKICAVNVENTIHELLQAQEEMKEEMKNRFADGKNMIQRIGRRLDILE